MYTPVDGTKRSLVRAKVTLPSTCVSNRVNALVNSFSCLGRTLLMWKLFVGIEVTFCLDRVENDRNVVLTVALKYIFWILSQNIRVLTLQLCLYYYIVAHYMYVSCLAVWSNDFFLINSFHHITSGWIRKFFNFTIWKGKKIFFYLILCYWMIK